MICCDSRYLIRNGRTSVKPNSHRPARFNRTVWLISVASGRAVCIGLKQPDDCAGFSSIAFSAIEQEVCLHCSMDALRTPHKWCAKAFQSNVNPPARNYIRKYASLFVRALQLQLRCSRRYETMGTEPRIARCLSATDELANDIVSSYQRTEARTHVDIMLGLFVFSRVRFPGFFRPTIAFDSIDLPATLNRFFKQ